MARLAGVPRVAVAGSPLTNPQPVERFRSSVATEKRQKTTKSSPAEPVSWWNENPRRIEAFELRFRGKSWTAIARKFGTEWHTARKWAEHPDWKEKWDERCAQAALDAEAASEAALRELRTAAVPFVRQLKKLSFKPSGKSGQTQLGATRDALDRLGVRVVEKQGGLAIVLRELLGGATGHCFEAVINLSAEAMGLKGEDAAGE